MYNTRNFFIVIFTLLFAFSHLNAQILTVEKSSFVYKTVSGANLEMVVYQPNVPNNGIKLPVLVFFFGGGWVNGNPDHFELQAEYFASRGMVVFCPDYRTKSKHGTTPFESVKDANSAIRYLKINGDKLGIDTSKIVAAGGSAGGHLAACTAIIENVNEETDDLTVSTMPMALVLFNPVVDTGKRGYGQEKMDGHEFEISPVHHITSGVPETLIMHGEDDTTVPYENVVRFKEIMQQQGNRCILVGFKNQKHGFFNYKNSPKYFKKTMQKTESFLEDKRLLRGESWLKSYCKGLEEKTN